MAGKINFNGKSKIQILNEGKCFSIVKLRLMYINNNGYECNKNKINFSRSCYEKSKEGFLDKPIIFRYDQDNRYFVSDVTTHSKTESEKFMTRIAGHIPKDSKIELVEEDGVTYVECEAIIQKLYVPELVKILKKNNGKLSISMEILYSKENAHYDKRLGILAIDEFLFTGVALLSPSVKPGIEGSEIKVLHFEKNNGDFFNAEFEKMKKEKEVKGMENTEETNGVVEEQLNNEVEEELNNEVEENKDNEVEEELNNEVDESTDNEIEEELNNEVEEDTNTETNEVEFAKQASIIETLTAENFALKSEIKKFADYNEIKTKLASFEAKEAKLKQAKEKADLLIEFSCMFDEASKNEFIEATKELSVLDFKEELNKVMFDFVKKVGEDRASHEDNAQGGLTAQTFEVEGIKQGEVKKIKTMEEARKALSNN